MELSKKEKQIISRALRIAQESMQIVFSKNQIEANIKHPNLAEGYIEMQSSLIEDMDKIEKLIDKFRELQIKNEL